MSEILNGDLRPKKEFKGMTDLEYKKYIEKPRGTFIDVECPECKNSLVVREGAHKFLGCSNYPECTCCVVNSDKGIPFSLLSKDSPAFRYAFFKKRKNPRRRWRTRSDGYENIYVPKDYGPCSENENFDYWGAGLSGVHCADDM